MTFRPPVIVIAVLSAAIALISVARGGQSTQSEPPVSLEELARRGITGRLGVPLGTIVNIEGEIVPNESRAKMDSDAPFFLRIKAVDGKPLQQAVQYRFTKADEWLKMKQPNVGDTFRYVGYETGTFIGSPKGEFDHRPPYATTEFGFATRFAIVAAKTGS